MNAHATLHGMMHIIYAHIWCLAFSTSCASSSQLLLIPEAVKRVSFGVDKNGDSTTSWLSALGLSCCSKHPRPWPSNRCRCPRHPYPWPFQWWCRYWCCCSSPRRWPYEWQPESSSASSRVSRISFCSASDLLRPCLAQVLNCSMLVPSSVKVSSALLFVKHGV